MLMYFTYQKSDFSTFLRQRHLCIPEAFAMDGIPAENSCFAGGFHSRSSQWYLLVDWRVRLQTIWGVGAVIVEWKKAIQTTVASKTLLALLIHYEKVWLKYRHMMTYAKLSRIVSLHHPTSLPMYPKLNYKRIQSLCLLRQPPGMSPMRQRWNIIFKQPSRCWVHALER